ncbi:MAG: tRNA1(Val) (adenine(37)-N6)-methyltransferase [Chitinophagaceae bacterium]
MKVCTDACIQGAYAAKRLSESGKAFKNVLDIGTGTGLLTLMLAQKNSYLRFDAIELNNSAYLQAKENIAHSTWAKNISVIHGDIRNLPLSGKYDFIICNPPFYEDEAKSNKPHKNQSKHSIDLSHLELKDCIIGNLSENGTACVMLPEKQFAWFKQLMEKDSYQAIHLLKVRQTPVQSGFRIIGFFNKNIHHGTIEELCICSMNGKYSREFKAFLKDYYLYLDA